MTRADAQRLLDDGLRRRGRLDLTEHRRRDGELLGASARWCGLSLFGPDAATVLRQLVTAAYQRELRPVPDEARTLPGVA